MNEFYPYIIDCHTHNRDSLTGVISLEPHELDVMRPGRVYSVGVHPWRASLATDDDIHRVEEAATRSEVVMIGECGLDRVCDTPMEDQMRVFRRMVELSERVGKPLLLHVVRAFGSVMELHKALRPRQPWIIHGFRGKPELARQLVAEGMYLSFGERYNKESLSATPSDRVLQETDEAREINARLPHAAENLQRVIFPLIKAH